MVAEAVVETEVTSPETDALALPDTSTEAPPAEQTTEQEPDYTGVLKELGFEDEATTEVDGAKPKVDGQAPSLADLTPEQAFEQGKRATQAEAEARSRQAQDQAYIAGVSRSYQAVTEDLDRKADELGLSVDDRKWLKDRFSIHNGHWNTLAQHREAQMTEEVKAGMRLALTQAGAKFTGDDKFEPGAAMDEYVGRIADHARKGYSSAADVKKAVSDGQAKLLKKLEDAGVALPGRQDMSLPEARGVGASGPGPRNLVAYNSATMEQRAAWDKADPNLVERLVAEAQRRGG